MWGASPSISALRLVSAMGRPGCIPFHHGDCIEKPRRESGVDARSQRDRGRPTLSRGAETEELGRHVDSWSSELGEHWNLWACGGLLLLFLMGLSAPLADIDLPMHLATGAWIVHHHGVPYVEPFAWTRLGAPYYAYSWLPEITYYFLYAHGGPLALRVLHGLTFAAGGVAMLWLGRVAGWRAWTAVLMAFLSILPQFLVAPFLRPQTLLFPTVILAWGIGLRILQSDRPALWGALLLLVAAVAANSHLLFPLTALPLAIAISRDRIPVRRGALVFAALLCGWLLGPYGLQWVDVFRLNFGHNVLFSYPSPIAEFVPGFRAAVLSPGEALVAALLAIVPFAVPSESLSIRERAVFVSLWLVGLFGFGLASRALVVWFITTLPLLALALERFSPPRVPIRRVMLLTMASLPILLSLRLLLLERELGAGIASPAAPSVEPLASWLDHHVRDGVRRRMLTSFDYGSYLTWRLPGYSMSIDGRTIFPDSVAAPDAYRVAGDRSFEVGPWRSADMAILPLHFPTAAVLDTASGWVRVDTVPEGPRVPVSTGLWSRRALLEAERP